MLTHIQQTADFIRDRISFQPEIAIILGSGLGDLQKEVHDSVILPYEQLPNFPQTTVKGHTGKLIFGEISGKKVAMMSGRFHYYEGYSMQEVTFPIRVFKFLGIEKLIVSNAAGGVNPSFSVGDVMIITDHINMFPEHPLRGKNFEELGPRFPDMSEAYDKTWVNSAFEIAKKLGIELKKGVYLGLQGPTFETPAEYGMVRALGADAVGMSTVPEIIVARHMNMRCFALSVITDLGGPGIAVEVSHEEVLNAAQKAMPKVIKLVKEMLPLMN